MNKEAELVSEDILGTNTQDIHEQATPSPIRLRSLAISGPISDDVPINVIRALISLESEEPKSPIVMFINTPGGNVYDAFAIYDVMKSIKCPLITMGMGKIMSAGVLILSAGDKGFRYCLPNSYLMTHDIQCMHIGNFKDVNAEHLHSAELRDKYIKLLAVNSHLTKTKIRDNLMQHEYFFSATQAKEMGIIDHVSFKKPKAFLRE